MTLPTDDSMKGPKNFHKIMVYILDILFSGIKMNFSSNIRN